MSEIAAAVAAIFSSHTTINALLLVADALIYFTVLAALFRGRHRLGIGSFFCALGVMHFLETYLASIFYVALPFGIVTSPGSTVLFTGKLMLLLLVYIREDAVVVRQPIYGLLIGNLLMFALAFLMRHHELVRSTPDARRFRFPRRDGRADGVGHARSCSSMHHDHSAVRAIARLVAATGCSCGSGSPARGADFDQVAFYLRPAYPHRRAACRCCSAAGSRKWRRSRSTAVLGGVYLRWVERAAPQPRAAAAHRRRVRPADLSRALRGSAGALGPRRADRRARSRPARDAGPAASSRTAALAGRPREPAHHRHRSFQELQRPLRPCRRRRRAQAHRAHHHARRRASSDCVFRFGGEEFVVIVR